MHDRPLIRLLRGDGGTVRGIAREQAASRNAVRRALAPDARDHYYRPSATEDAEPAVRDVLADYPHMTVSDIGVLIDWRHSRRQLSDLVARLRPVYTPGPAVDARPIDQIRAGRLAAVGTVHVGTLSCGTVEAGEVEL